MSIALPILSLFGFLIIGIPVGFALAIAGALGFLINSGWDVMGGILQFTPHASAASFVLTSIPMFILMAEFATKSGVTEKAFGASNRWLGHLPGGLGIATVIASTGLAAISGSSTASAASLSKTAVDEMKKYNYKRSFAAGVASVAGTLAVLIPPSIILIVYGVLTEVPIGPLLIAGIIPGILTAIGYIVSIIIIAKKWPEDAPRAQKFSYKERVESLKGVIPMMILIIFMFAAIYSGAVTPTEAGAVGGVAALLIWLFMGGFKKEGLKDALSRTAQSTCMIFMIIIGAMIFGYFIASVQIAQMLIEFIGGLSVSPLLIMGIIVLIYLILGAFMDQLAILFLTLPLTFPISQALGFDPIWFGIVVVKAAEIGLITPPLGMNVFVTANVAKIPVAEVFQGVWKLLIVELIILALLFFIPALSTWLPSMMNS